MSLIELLIALAISAMLLTATAVALDASFRAYADAAEQASAQAATRMVVNRLLTLIRTSTAHGPLSAQSATTMQITDPDDGVTQRTATISASTLSGNTTTGPYIELIDPTGQDIKIVFLRYTSKAGVAKEELWLVNLTTHKSQPLIGGVTGATFSCLRRKNAVGLWVLERGTMDLAIQPGADATLTLEHGHPTPIRVVASTMPRRVE